jgi:hypothetical protein
MAKLPVHQATTRNLPKIPLGRLFNVMLIRRNIIAIPNMVISLFGDAVI